jgi:hypothetical protein
MIQKAVDELNEAIADLKPQYRRYVGFAAHEVEADQNAVASKLIEAVTNALPFVKSIVDHHESMMTNSGYRLVIKSLVPSRAGGHWDVVFTVIDEDGKPTDVNYSYDLRSNRWRSSLAVSRRDIVHNAGVSIDFLAGFEAALNAIEIGRAHV